MQGLYKNFAFISYSHRDIKIAKWLQRKLESYRLPTEVGNEIKQGERYLRPVFRDQSDLNTGILKDELRKNLEESKFLILICSPSSANSQWVSEEARIFVESGRIENIIPVLCPDGKTPESDLFPQYLREYFINHPDKELLGINIGEVGREKAVVRVISRMLGINFDTLWKRHRRKTIVNSVTTCTSGVAIIGAIYLFGVPVKLDVRVTLEDSTLPLGKEIYLKTGKAEYNSPINAPDFTNLTLPGYKRFSSTELNLTSEYFEPLDTTIFCGLGTHKTIDLKLLRDKTFAIFSGKISHSDLQPISGVKVSIGNEMTLSDSNGCFEISLPLNKQKAEQAITLTKDGFKTITRQDEVPGRDLRFIMHPEK